MADVSKIKLPDGTTYNIKDTVSGYITTVPVTSVNEQTGDVTITEGLEPLIGTTSTVTPQQVMTALEEGRDICITATASVLIVMLSIDMSVKFTAFTRVTDIPNSGQGIDVVVSQAIVKYNNAYVVIDLYGGIIGGESKAWTADSNYLATSDALELVQSNIPASTSQLTNDSGFITNETETDPTVPSWAKASSKPTYTALEVGALASDTTYVSTVTTTAGIHTAISSKSGAVSFNVPTKTSHLTNDSGFLTSAPVTSVNGSTGDVVLTIPTKTSELTNDGDGANPFVTRDRLSDYVQTGELADILVTPTFWSCDSTSQAVLQQAFGVTTEIVVPSDFTSQFLLIYRLEPRTWFCWMNGTEMEFARLSVSVNTSNSAVTLYLRGRTSIATGIMGVDSSWTVTPLASDAEGVAY